MSMTNQQNKIVAQDVSFVYPGSDHKVLKNLNVKIEKGMFLAIIGGNGSGKTTMCKLFNGIIPHFFTGDLSGVITINGVETTTSDVSVLSEKVGYVYQDFENAIVRATVFDEVSFAPLNYGFDDFEERAWNVLKILEIEHLADEYIWQLSGGQKHLVALAAVLSVDPEYIIIDEPVAQLDPFNAEQTYEMLKKLHEEYDKTIIVIEHHTEFIANYCSDVLLMKDGSVSWIKPVQEALQDVESLVDANIQPPQVTQLAHRLEVSKNKLPINIDQAQAIFIEHDFQVNFVNGSKDFLENSQSDKNRIVEIRDLIVSYKDQNRELRPILKGINLDLFKDERIAIVGNNGAGKSTLMKTLSRLMKAEEGYIRINETDISEISPEELASVVSYIYQNPAEMFIDDNVESDISFYMRSRNIDGYKEKVNTIIESLDLEEFRDQDARLLSGGQQRRVSLGIGMGMHPQIIMLDEPTGSLDIVSRQEVIKLLEFLKNEIHLAIVATHDMQLVADWATRVIVINKGEIIADTTPRKLFQRKDILDQAHLKPPQIVELSQTMNMDPIALSIYEMQQALRKQKVS